MCALLDTSHQMAGRIKDAGRTLFTRPQRIGGIDFEEDNRIVDLKIEQLLDQVQKPARYMGGELNSIQRDFEHTGFRYCFGFPDVYEVGMSHVGSRILYDIINNASALAESLYSTSHQGQNFAKNLTTEGMVAAAVSMSIIPIVLAYPFVQRYMIQGITVGSVKG